jgi:Transposase, Mutator family
LRALLKTFVEALMGAEADAVCGASYGVRSEERVNFRNGYRRREWDTRAGTVELVVVEWMVAGTDGKQQARTVICRHGARMPCRRDHLHKPAAVPLSSAAEADVRASG